MLRWWREVLPAEAEGVRAMVVEVVEVRWCLGPDWEDYLLGAFPHCTRHLGECRLVASRKRP